jgi:hypothetical protein
MLGRAAFVVIFAVHIICSEREALITAAPEEPFA